MKDNFSLTFGINVQMPIYIEIQETIMLGIKKEL